MNDPFAPPARGDPSTTAQACELKINTEPRDPVQEPPDQRWSPEQISPTLPVQHPDWAELRLTHERSTRRCAGPIEVVSRTVVRRCSASGCAYLRRPAGPVPAKTSSHVSRIAVPL
jgi:hypothetical protein